MECSIKVRWKEEETLLNFFKNKTKLMNTVKENLRNICFKMLCKDNSEGRVVIVMIKPNVQGCLGGIGVVSNFCTLQLFRKTMKIERPQKSCNNCYQTKNECV